MPTNSENVFLVKKNAERKLTAVGAKGAEGMKSQEKLETRNPKSKQFPMTKRECCKQGSSD
jgi:hypothetical protein